MSRAFVKESDHDTQSLPELAVSPHPNLVTAAGLGMIESRVRELEAEQKGLRELGDSASLARVNRDLRYWSQRRASARLVAAIESPDAVRFGVEVTLEFEDGTARGYRLVGEDEADPSRGLVSWVSPFAQALFGKRIGDTAEVLGRTAEIVRLA